MEQISLTVLIGIITSLFGVFAGYKGYERNRRKENRSEGQETGVVLTEIGYIKSGIDDIKRRQHEQAQINTELFTRLAMAEASLKQAHHRVDRVDGKLNPDRCSPIEA